MWEGSLVSLIIDLFAVIAYSWVTYTLLSGLLYDVSLRRLTKASFNIDSDNFLDLFSAYLICIFAFIFIYLYIDLDKSNLSTASFSALGLILIYLGRIITRKQGCFYGKLHFTSIFISALLVLIVELLKLDKFEFSDLASGLNPSSLISGFNNIFLILIKYIGIVWDYDTKSGMTSSPLVISLAGCLFLSTIGEWILSNTTPEIKSYLACAEKFPSDFKVITGITSEKDNIADLLQKIFKDKIISIRCVTKSLVWVDLLEKSIRKQSESNRNSDKRVDLDYRILKSPRDNALSDYWNAIDALPFPVVKSKKFINDEYNLFLEKYQKRWDKLLVLNDVGLVNARNYYFKDILFLIVENESRKYSLLFLVKDKGNMENRVGLFTEQPYFINIFINIFDTAWIESEQFSVDNP